MVELPLDGGQVREDIRVIKLKVVQHRRAWTVVHELGALVEKGAVVLVRLDDEERRAPQARGNPEVLRHPADEKAGRHAGVFQQPGQQTGGRGFAMGAGYRQYPAILQHMPRQPFGAGHVGHALIQHVLHCRVAAGHGIADDDHVRGRLQMLGTVPLLQGNTLFAELGTHRRIDVGVRAADLMAQFACQQRQRPHERTADAENVEMHEMSLSQSNGYSLR